MGAFRTKLWHAQAFFHKMAAILIFRFCQNRLVLIKGSVKYEFDMGIGVTVTHSLSLNVQRRRRRWQDQ